MEFRKSASAVDALYAAYKDHPNVAMFLVYVQEFDASSRDPVFAEATTLGARAEAARACAEKLNLGIPILLDTLDDAAARAYHASTAATAVIDLDGTVAFHSEGHFGIQAGQAGAVLAELLKGTSPPVRRNDETQKGDFAGDRPLRPGTRSRSRADAAGYGAPGAGEISPN